MSAQRALGRPAARAAAGLLACAAVLSGCSGPEPDGVAAATSTPPPPTTGVMPWAADLHGFGRREARCFGDDVAVRLMWSSDSYFAACRNAQGSRYLRAWAPGGPGGRNEAPPHVGMQGDFFTETANSLQFVANGAKIDLGPRTVTIVWPRPEGSPVTRSTSYQTGAGWTRLN